MKARAAGMPSDLRTFLAEIDDLLLRVARRVDLDYVSALIADARQPILFEELEGYPGWKLCDLLFHNRPALTRWSIGAMLQDGPLTPGWRG